MPFIRKSPTPLEISKLLDPQSADSPIFHIFQELHQREQLNRVLQAALLQVGLEQFCTDIALGEITHDGQIKLVTQRAGIVSKLKNKLPSLLNFFRESGFALKAIHLKVSPKLTTIVQSPLTELVSPKKISPTHQDAWQKLLQEVPPNSPIFVAIKNLLRHSK